MHPVKTGRITVHICDIRPRILLRQAMSGHFGEAASRYWHTRDRRQWAHVTGSHNADGRKACQTRSPTLRSPARDD